VYVDQTRSDITLNIGITVNIVLNRYRIVFKSKQWHYYQVMGFGKYLWNPFAVRPTSSKARDMASLAWYV